MSKTLILMQGIPASGKSTVARAIAINAANSVIFSTDEFWYIDGRYVYEASHAAQAHAWNQRRCLEAMQSEEYETIIIDNTNTTQKEADPYIFLAKIFAWDIQVVRVTAPFETCLERNAERPRDRQVPEVVIDRMNLRMTDLNV